jgi:hypothetical protein
VNDQVDVFVVLAAYSAFVLSGRNLNSEAAYEAQIPQLFHDTATTVFVPVQKQLSVWETIIARPRGRVVGQCRHGGGAERALRSHDGLRAVDLPIRWPGQLTFSSRALMGGTCQRHCVHGVPRRSSARERISLMFRRLLRAPAP